MDFNVVPGKPDFFANSSDDEITTTAEVRGRITPELWNPLTGETAILQVEHVRHDEEDYTRFPLNLGAVTAQFVVD